MPKRWLKQFLLLFMTALMIAFGLTFWSTTQAATKFFYTVTELSSLGGLESGAYDLNDLGQIVGYSETNTERLHSVLWNNNGKIAADWTGIGGANYAVSINNVGQVACTTAQKPRLHGRCPYVWQDGNITSIRDCADNSFVYVSAINNAGQVAGWDTNYPFIWKDGVTTPLSGIDSNIGAGQALDINNRGQAVGDSGTSKGLHAVLWEKNGKLKVLAKLPGGNSSSALGINRHGKVVGWSDTSSGIRQAVLWENGTIKNLGTFDGNATKATDINARGTVVGYSYTINSRETPQHAFVWKNGIMRDLNKLLPANSGWELNTAQAINNQGQIVGEGKFNGQQRAYLLTPTWITS